jgi:hypothetical protein
LNGADGRWGIGGCRSCPDGAWKPSVVLVGRIDKRVEIYGFVLLLLYLSDGLGSHMRDSERETDGLIALSVHFGCGPVLCVIVFERSREAG